MIRSAMTLVIGLAAAASGQPELRVPVATAVIVDGRADDAEWASAVRQSSKSGLRVQLQQDETSLYVSVTAPSEGFSSVCIGDVSGVRILHASAALGAVDYVSSGGAWAPAQKSFVYSMRNTTLTREAAAERRAYLAEHRWVANTVRMSTNLTQEFQIDRRALRPGIRMAVGYYVIAGGGSVLTWPDSVAEGDGCVDIDLVRGNVPASLTFDPARWVALSFGR